MKTVIVIPLYKNALTIYEYISLFQCLNVLKKYDKYIICAKSFEISNKLQDIIKKYNIYVKQFDNDYFLNTIQYSKLCLTADFYIQFKQYDYMLIYQLDAYIFKDNLEYFVNLGYDYIGAPWCRNCDNINNYPYNCKIPGNKTHNYPNNVGNGGFSLRKIPTCIKVLSNIKYESLPIEQQQFEDNFFANCCMIKKPICSIARLFSAETIGNFIYKNLNDFPCGSHNLFYHSTIFKNTIDQMISDNNLKL